jgi:hypothetical protein
MNPLFESCPFLSVQFGGIQTPTVRPILLSNPDLNLNGPNDQSHIL